MTTDYLPLPQSFRFGWQTTGKHPWFFLFIFAVILSFGAVFYVILERLASYGDQETAYAWMMLHASLAVFILFAGINGMLLIAGIIRLSLQFYDGKMPRWHDLFSAYPLFIKYLTASILYGIIILGGTVLLVIPGIIWATRYSFCFILIADKGMGPWEALVRSSIMTREKTKELLFFYAVLAGVNTLGFLALIVGLLFSLPVSILACVYVYRTFLGVAETPAP